MALDNILDTSEETTELGGERAQEEIAKLKKVYQELDEESRLILQLLLILSGLDFIAALWLLGRGQCLLPLGVLHVLVC